MQLFNNNETSELPANLGHRPAANRIGREVTNLELVIGFLRHLPNRGIVLALNIILIHVTHSKSTYHILIGYAWARAHRLTMTPYYHEKESLVQHKVEHAQCAPLEPRHDDEVHSHVICDTCHT